VASAAHHIGSQGLVRLPCSNQIANALTANYDDLYLMVLLIDEAP